MQESTNPTTAIIYIDESGIANKIDATIYYSATNKAPLEEEHIIQRVHR